MDIAAYISSGVLELYATGGLPASERAEVETLARQYPEIQAELDAISQTLDLYAQLHALNPPAQLKNKVLAAVTGSGNQAAPVLSQVRETPNQPEETGEEPSEKEDNLIFPMVPVEKRAASAAFKWLVAASLALLLISNALSIYFYRNWKDSENRLQLAVASQQQFASNLRQVQQRLSQNQMAVALLRDPQTKRVELKGVEKSPASRVTVYWHQSTKNVYLAVDKLPSAPRDQQYQLWALVDGKPVDAGMIDSTEAFVSLQHMKDIVRAQAFAITLEPKGGSAAPTMAQMYVMGNI